MTTSKNIPPYTPRLTALLAQTLFISGAWAADQELKPVIVTGSPEKTPVIERIERTQAREIRDIFAAESEANVGGGDRQARRLFLRGVEGSNVNITVDGARQGQNLYNHRGGLMGVDPAILKRVDIQPGPAPADGGPGALGGSIRFETKDAQDLLSAGRRAGAFVKAGYGSASKSKTLNTAVYGMPFDKLGLLAYLGGTDTELMRIGGGDKVPFSAYDDRNYLLKASLLDLQSHSLRLARERNTTNGLNYQQRGDFPWQIQPPPGTRPPRDQTLTRDTTTLNYRWNPASPWLDLEANLYRNESDWHSPNNFGERFISKGEGGKLQNSFSFKSGDITNRLTLGVDWLRDRGAAFGNNQPARPQATDNRNTGYYLQNRLRAGALKLSFGARRDHYETLYGVQTVKGDIDSFNFGGEYALTNALDVFAGWGESARGYGTIPIHFARSIAATASVPTQPEQATQQELGLRHKADGVFTAGGRLVSEFTLFKNEIDNFIGYTHGGPPGGAGLGNRPVIAVWNQRLPIEHRGYTARLGWQGDDYYGNLSYTHIKSSNLPPWEALWARAGAPSGDKLVWDNRYRIAPGLTLGYTLTAVNGLRKLPNVAPPTVAPPPGTTHSRNIEIRARSGYALHDVQLEWQPAGLRDFTLSLSAHNLFDKRYSNHTTLSQSGFATEEPGRDVRVSLRYRF